MNINELGLVVAARTVYDLSKQNEEFNVFINECFGRYIKKDWGDLTEEDKHLNDLALTPGQESRILAAYSFPEDASWGDIFDNKLWIITEWDRSVTTILFPSEY